MSEWAVFGDLAWILVILMVAAPAQRMVAVGYVVATLVTVRLQAELIASLGQGDGLVPFLGDSPVLWRGQIIYGVFTALYALLLWLSPRTPWSVTLSAGIVFYITAFTISMVIMAI